MTRAEFDRLTGKERLGLATEAELAALEPYRVRRAVFMAAGFGSRMAPLTERIPKPLVTVHGRRIIDSLLDAVTAAGIEEIYIVRGYKAEMFNVLLEKYPTVQFIENGLYARTNAIYSTLLAAEHLQNAYVMEADLLLSDPGLITKYQYESNFLALPVERTDDWCFTVDGEGRIRSVQKGGEDCCQMFVLSYWTAADGARLAGHIREAFNAPGGRDIFFEQVPLNLYPDQYAVRARLCAPGDIVEIDTLAELRALDKSYEDFP